MIMMILEAHALLPVQQGLRQGGQDYLGGLGGHKHNHTNNSGSSSITVMIININSINNSITINI